MSDTYYVVHSTVVDPLPESTYGTSPSAGDNLKLAVAWCKAALRARKRSFITQRDRDGLVEAVIPVFLTGDDGQYNLSTGELAVVVALAQNGRFDPPTG